MKEQKSKFQSQNMQMSFSFLKNHPPPGSSWPVKTTACHAGHFSLAISQTVYLNPQVASGQLTPWQLRYPQPLPRTEEEPTGRAGDCRRVSHTPKPCAWKIVFKGKSTWIKDWTLSPFLPFVMGTAIVGQKTGPCFGWHIKRDLFPQFLVPISDLKYFFMIPLLPLKGLWPIPFSGCWL